MKVRPVWRIGKTAPSPIGAAPQRKLALAVSIRHRIVCNLIGTQQSQNELEKT